MINLLKRLLGLGPKVNLKPIIEKGATIIDVRTLQEFKAGHIKGSKNIALVGSFRPNSIGLYDMSGNVWEWCWDWYGKDYYEQSKNSNNPKGPPKGVYRVIRVGSWSYVPASVRVADRFRNYPDYRRNSIGFRLARAAP